jgi:hypothetical protein
MEMYIDRAKFILLILQVAKVWYIGIHRLKTRSSRIAKPKHNKYKWWEEQCLKKAGEAHCRSRVCINGLTWSCKKEFHSFHYLRGGEGIPAN